MRRIAVREVGCKSLLNPLRFGGTGGYTANFFRGCIHGCVYCYVPSLIRDDRQWGGYVDVRVNAPAVLEKELRLARRGVVFLSSATDPYQAVEARYRVTRRCLEVLCRHDFPVSILTRSPLVLRDIDLLRRFRWARVGFSISSLTGRAHEPGVASLERRIECLRRLSAAGMTTWVSMAPILPGQSVEMLTSVVETLKDAGVKAISPGLLRFDGYERSRKMFEESASTQASRALVGGEEALRAVKEAIRRHGLDRAQEVLGWQDGAGPLDQFVID